MNAVASPRRPVPLLLAAGLLYAAAVALALLAVLATAYLGRLRNAVRVGYDDRANVDQLVSQATTGTVAVVAGLVAGAVLLCLLATFDLHGSRITRAGSWVAAGAGVLCCGGSGLFDRLGDDRVTALAYPHWYRAVHGWLVLSVVLALAATAALLAAPSVGGYLRDRTEQPT